MGIMEKKMETTIMGYIGFRLGSPVTHSVPFFLLFSFNRETQNKKCKGYYWGT